MTGNIRWGIIAPGGIGRKFARGLAAPGGGVLGAVASRELSRAEDFAGEFSLHGGNRVKAFGSYRELADDPSIDIVYIASPHPFHYEHALLCIEKGKSVLVEKPFAVNAEQARLLINAARSRNVFCMEAVWSRFLPALQAARKTLSEGRIGTLRMIRGDFSFSSDAGPEHRLFNPSLAGGALLDVGIYVLSIAGFFAGSPPARVCGHAEKGPTGVDVQDSISAQWDSGITASLTCGVTTRGPVSFDIIGTDGVIEISQPFFATQGYSLRNEQGVSTFEFPHEINGYEYEAREAVRCLSDGLLESPGMPLNESLRIVEIMDELRAEWKIKYPFE